MMKYYTVVFFLCFSISWSFEQQPLSVLVNGTDLSCANSYDGRFQIQVLSGNPPIQYSWLHLSNGLNYSSSIASLNGVTNLENMGKGTYRLTFTDAIGQSVTTDKTLTAPPPIVTALYAEGDVCFGENEGLIRVENISGGVGPYECALDDVTPFGTETEWSNLMPGTYFLNVRDATGCISKESVILPFGTQFVVEPLPDTSIISGDTLVYQVISPNYIDTIIWLPSIYGQTLDSGLIRLFPFYPTAFKFLAIDNKGCQAFGELFVDVTRRRDAYFPNVFQPSATDPQNQRFAPYTSYGVSYVKSFQVFDRLGRQVFENYKFSANDPQQGWDGNAGGDAMPADVYIWGAVLRFFDGREEQYWGDVTLIR